MKMKMKQLLLVALTLVCICSMCACGSSKKEAPKEESKKEEKKNEWKEALIGEWGEIILNGSECDTWFYVFGKDDVYYKFLHTNSNNTMLTYLGYDTGTYEVTKDEIIFHQTETCSGKQDPVKEESTESYPYKFEDSLLYIGFFSGQEFRPYHKDDWKEITTELTSKTSWYAQEQLIHSEYEDYIFYR